MGRENKWSRYITIGISLLVVGIVLYFLWDILIYVLIAWVLSLIGQPLVNLLLNKLRLKRLKAGSTISALIVMVFFITFFTIVITFLAPLFITQADILTKVNYQHLLEGLDEPITQVDNWLHKMGILEAGTTIGDQVEGDIRTIFAPQRIGNVFSSILSLAGNVIFGAFSVLFILFFLLKEQGLMLRFFQVVTPKKHDEHIESSLDKLTTLLSRYFIGIGGQITIFTFVVSISLSLLGIKNAFLIGIFGAFINVIPYLGPMLGAAFGMLIVITTNIDVDFYQVMVPKLIIVAAVFSGMQLIDNFLLQPIIFSKSVLAHPLEIFIIILIGGKIGGVFGMIVAIPTYSVLRVIANVFLHEFEVIQQLTNRVNEMK